MTTRTPVHRLIGLFGLVSFVVLTLAATGLSQDRLRVRDELPSGKRELLGDLKTGVAAFRAPASGTYWSQLLQVGIPALRRVSLNLTAARDALARTEVTKLVRQDRLKKRAAGAKADKANVLARLQAVERDLEQLSRQRANIAKAVQALRELIDEKLPQVLDARLDDFEAGDVELPGDTISIDVAELEAFVRQVANGGAEPASPVVEAPFVSQAGLSITSSAATSSSTELGFDTAGGGSE